MDVSQADIVLKNITSQAKAVDIAAINLCCSKTGRFPPCDRARGGLYYPGNTAAVPTVLQCYPRERSSNFSSTAILPQVTQQPISTVLQCYPRQHSSSINSANASALPVVGSAFSCAALRKRKQDYAVKRDQREAHG